MRELERLSSGASSFATRDASPVMRVTPKDVVEVNGSGLPEIDSLNTPPADSANGQIDSPRRKSTPGRPKGSTRWTDADLRRALLDDAEVESSWVKFATQVRIETRERLNAYVLHGKRKRFNSTRIQDVVDMALSRYLDEQGFARTDDERHAA